MISSLFNTIFYQPLYNGLIYLMDTLPFFDAGVIVIIFTIVVKLIMFPLSIKATKAQMEMKDIEKDLERIKEQYPDKQVQTQKTIELYKEKNINPFAGFFVLLLQLPIIIALYQIFLKSGLPVINMELLYSFVSAPLSISMNFLGLIDIAGKSIPLAIIAGISTYFQIAYATPPASEPEPGKKPTMQQDVMKMMQTQMKYGFPVLVTFISWSVSAAVSIYWITSNLFTIGQELYIRKKIRITK
ncbi:MAG: YidC/Oxa1 family membrane protein insertase [Candidatus Zambryskibacteria bacterium]|nr:YidC/Oxa1 family membrane protein insertase [Candidatus Zambryskibacteria bacterium]